VCNNLPAESTSPENGWRSSVLPIPHRHMAKKNFFFSERVVGVRKKSKKSKKISIEIPEKKKKKKKKTERE